VTQVVSSIMPFPPIRWWATILHKDILLFDKAEHFKKMTFRNRYHICNANGKIQLSIPIDKGRNNRASMKDIKIADEKWQLQHLRTLTSAYNRSSFFEYFAPGLQELFEKSFTYLIDFNLASTLFIQQQLKLEFKIDFAEEFHEKYENMADLRKSEPKEIDDFPPYYQVFNDRINFLPNLSILDLLFSQGLNTKKWLDNNREKII
jgi:hypothetical protein